MKEIPFVKTHAAELLLIGILLLSGFLNIWNIWNAGITNTYYAAAVRSMLGNPSLLVYNSFDPGGFITVDKPPFGLWVQCLSAVLLGFSGWALVLPQALAGVGSVALVYLIVSRPFGKPAGLVSAFALAVTPIFVAVSRNGTMDGTLIFVLLLALWMALRAAREQSLPRLLVSAILVGLGFNIKMIQAFIVVPAITAIYLIGAGGLPVKKRLVHVLLAIGVLVAVSLSWAVAVDMVPADQRPYIGGSGDNTVLGLIVNYNGIHRIENGIMAQGGTAGSPPTGIMQASGDGTSPGPGMSANRTAGQFGSGEPADRDTPPGAPTDAMGQGPGMGTGPEGGTGGMPGAGTGVGSRSGGNGGGGMDNEGSPGLLRLLGQGLAGQISWLLPFALISLAVLWRRPSSLPLNGLTETGLFGERGLTLAAFGLWLLPGLLYFSFTTGFWHTYYLATIAPPLAAVAGIGAVAMYDAWRTGGSAGWILIAAVLVTGLVQVFVLLYTAAWSGVLPVILAAGTIVLAILLAVLKIKTSTGTGILPKTAAFLAIGLLFVCPFIWSCTPFLYGTGNVLPVAGPQLAQSSGNGGGGMGMPGSQGLENVSGLAEYLISHSTGEKFLVAVPDSMDGAAELILATGKPVMALGGFSGSDQVLTVDSLSRMVSDGEIRFFSIPSTSTNGSGSGSTGMIMGNPLLYTWVQDHCKAVSSSDWSGSTTSESTAPGIPSASSRTNSTVSDMRTSQPGMGGMNSLYDCSGYTRQAGA
ncbi:glycosyltransferase family 39 protein [Methanoregula sp.]|jgi:4-amino-4-deoxy-L-arabinose transferase-like glycosyltransferase|uniref:glycosyltransferase family 39 protein n=1 Tax=Methanoregula sp. TaxID=2052170 RepID=UPI003C1E723F